jgi:hypothetical protein
VSSPVGFERGGQGGGGSVQKPPTHRFIGSQQLAALVHLSPVPETFPYMRRLVKTPEVRVVEALGKRSRSRPLLP